MSRLEDNAPVVIGLFKDLFECDGRPFGSPSLCLEGVCDGVEGVQWNAWHSLDDEGDWLGVNLEGKQYDGWLIARLIEREIADPLLLSEYRVRVAKPERVEVSWKRDAWQRRSRPPIVEAELPPTPIALDQLDRQGWTRSLRSARECLNPYRGYRGRRRTMVTLRVSGRLVEREVTPHLQFRTGLDWFGGSTAHAMRQAKENLEALHEFATRQARPAPAP